MFKVLNILLHTLETRLSTDKEVPSSSVHSTTLTCAKHLFLGYMMFASGQFTDVKPILSTHIQVIAYHLWPI